MQFWASILLRAFVTFLLSSVRATISCLGQLTPSSAGILVAYVSSPTFSGWLRDPTQPSHFFGFATFDMSSQLAPARPLPMFTYSAKGTTPKRASRSALASMSSTSSFDTFFSAFSLSPDIEPVLSSTRATSSDPLAARITSEATLTSIALMPAMFVKVVSTSPATATRTAPSGVIVTLKLFSCPSMPGGTCASK